MSQDIKPDNYFMQRKQLHIVTSQVILGSMGICIVRLFKATFVMKHGLFNMKRVLYLFVLVFKKINLDLCQIPCCFEFFPHCYGSLEQKVCMLLMYYGNYIMSRKAGHTKKTL